MPDFPSKARTPRDLYGGSYDAFLADFRSRIPLTRPDELLIEIYGYAAAYSADDDGTVRLPFDTNGALVPEVWERWLAWDPVRMARQNRYADALQSMRAIWIDAGNRDEFHLDLGATVFHQAVLDAGAPQERVHFELFDAGHGLIEYRYPLALAWLCRQLASWPRCAPEFTRGECRCTRHRSAMTAPIGGLRP
ncbi:hypothetical protein [Nonomuraea sp. CA-141351]|uniref:hypothetical protein n=1 Tax=Nonomuraea sp. CA-141351 TaxID=3239996 RepID=UPI003D91E8F8